MNIIKRHLLQNNIREIGRLEGLKPVVFGAFDLAKLPLPKDLTIHSEVRGYFANCIPSAFIDTGLYRLFNAQRIIRENTQAVPCIQLSPLGFVGIGSVLNGDSISVDVQTGRVYVFSHEVDYQEEGFDRKGILGTAEESFGSIAGFVRNWKKLIQAEVAKEKAFRSKAAKNPNATDEFGETELFRLIVDPKSTPDQIVEELRRGSNLEHRNNEGETPLMRAVIHQRPELLKLLIDAGAAVNAVTPRNLTTPLMFAARYATLPCMKLLLASGANADAVDSIGWPALKQVCVVHGTDEMRKLLRSHMASPRK